MDFKEASTFGINEEVLSVYQKLGWESFTRVQSKAIESGLGKGSSMVVSAPTSSGKTTIGEIAAILGALEGKKTVYLVSHRALAEEKYNYFKTVFRDELEKLFDVSIATGDHVDGDWDNGILVSTYEKYLSLITTSSNFSFEGKVVIADEIQILSDVSRGSEIEILCTIIRMGSPAQFIGLTATVPNVDELSTWFNCKGIKISHRDVPLRQEIWNEGRLFHNLYGQDELFEDQENAHVVNDTIHVVNNLLNLKLGPILVFTMTKPRAIELAQGFSGTREKDISAIIVGEQIELFSELTITVGILKETCERRTAFHSGDLSFEERGR
ncbi:MAG: DEAD/DEAH box helicase [Candidatus Marinimicrobia bacterium]|nr:DEAD/DEAH box helicase [Candidatus Neomarinimicrobiota bacterium]